MHGLPETVDLRTEIWVAHGVRHRQIDLAAENVSESISKRKVIAKAGSVVCFIFH
jgi:hypothetical protein